MDTEFFSLLFTTRFQDVQPDSALTYILLRSDILLGHTATAVMHRGMDEYISGISVHSIAQSLHAPPVSAERCLNDLCKRRWIIKHNDGFKLGSDKEGWYIKSPPRKKKEKVEEHSAIEKVRMAAKEGAARLRNGRVAEKTRIETFLAKKYKTEILDEVIPSRPEDKKALRVHLEQLYKRKYGRPIPDPEGKDDKSVVAQRSTYLSRMLKHFGSSVDEACRMLDKMFEEWEDIIKYRLTGDSKPNYRLIGTTSFWKKMQQVDIHDYMYFSVTGVRAIKEYFKQKHRDAFGYPPKAMTEKTDDTMHKIESKFVSFAIKTLDGKGERVLAIIDYLFKNWGYIRDKCKFTSSPGWTIFNSEKFLRFIEKCMTEGVAEKIIETRVSSWGGEGRRAD